MKKLAVLLFAVSVLGSISTVFADEPAPETATINADDGTQSTEGTEPLPDSSPAE